MTNDPFSDDYQPETPEITEEKPVDVTPPAPTQPTNTEVSVTLKGGTGFDAPWVVLRASSVGEAEALLDEQMQSLLKKAAQYGKGFAALGGGSGGGNGGGGGGQSQASGPQDHPQGKKEFCDHGEMRYKTGISGARSKNPGRPYAMFVCQSGDRANECRPKNA